MTRDITATSAHKFLSHNQQECVLEMAKNAAQQLKLKIVENNKLYYLNVCK